jgi:hypothetical protein
MKDYQTVHLEVISTLDNTLALPKIKLVGLYATKIRSTCKSLILEG